MKDITKLTLIITALVPLNVGLAATAVDFTYDNAGNNQIRTVDSNPQPGTVATWTFNDTATPLFNGTAGTPGVNNSNTVIYGGLDTSWATEASYDPSNVNKLDAGLLITKVNNGTAAFTSAYIWKKEDFLNGLDSGTLSLGDNSSFSLTTTKLLNTTKEVRFIVNQAGTYYVSNTTANNVATNVLADINGDTWAELTITTNAAGGNYLIGSTYSTVTFDDVRAVGIYADVTRSGQIEWNVTDFQFAAIPEASSYALVAGLLGLGSVMLRRRCK